MRRITGPHSAAGVVQLAAAYLVAAVPHARSDENWLRVYAVLLAMTGLPSALFHATLWWSGQKLDEFF